MNLCKPQTNSATDNKIQLLVADDHPVFRQTISAMFARHSDIRVIGEATDGESVVCMAREFQPDVILMDINMPNMNGVEATRIIHSELPNIRIIALSMHEDSNCNIDELKEAGATAYCTKDGDFNVMLSAVRGEL